MNRRHLRTIQLAIYSWQVNNAKAYSLDCVIIRRTAVFKACQTSDVG
jgi:hypothetical protein